MKKSNEIGSAYPAIPQSVLAKYNKRDPHREKTRFPFVTRSQISRVMQATTILKARQPGLSTARAAWVGSQMNFPLNIKVRPQRQEDVGRARMLEQLYTYDMNSLAAADFWSDRPLTDVFRSAENGSITVSSVGTPRTVSGTTRVRQDWVVDNWDQNAPF